MTSVLTLVALAASVLGAGMAYPQAHRLVRTKRTEGLSVTWIGVSLAINGWWTAYALAVSLWLLLPVSIASGVLYAVIGVLYFRIADRPDVRGLAVGGLGLGMVPLPFVLLGGWTVAGVAIGLCYGVQLAPAVIASFRSRDLAGVAAGTWMLSLVEAVLWLVYGLAVLDGALIAGGVTGTVMSSAILVRLVATGHQPFVRADQLASA